MMEARTRSSIAALLSLWSAGATDLQAVDRQNEAHFAGELEATEQEALSIITEWGACVDQWRRRPGGSAEGLWSCANAEDSSDADQDRLPAHKAALVVLYKCLLLTSTTRCAPAP